MAIFINPSNPAKQLINFAYGEEGEVIKVVLVDGNLKAGLKRDFPPYNCVTEGLNTRGVKDFSQAWYNCTSITSFPLIDTSFGTNFYETWYSCSSLTSFPLLDVSRGVDFSRTWMQSGITSFPSLDVGNGTDFSEAWVYTNLVEFPALDFSKGVNFNYSWAWLGLTSFPTVDFSSGLNFSGAWYGCGDLTTFPSNMFDNCQGGNFSQAWQNCALDQESVDNILQSLYTSGVGAGIVNINGGTSSEPSTYGWYFVAGLQARGWTVSVNGTPPAAWPPTNCNTNINTYGVTSFSLAWYYCTGLTSFPKLNASNVTNFVAAWFYCSGLTEFPVIDTSRGTSFVAAWLGCSSLTSFPLLDVSSGVNFGGAWAGCRSLSSFPLLDTSSGTNFGGAIWNYGMTGGAWRNCTGLESFPLLDVSNGENFADAWGNCSSLTSFPPLNLNKGIDFRGTWSECSSLQEFPSNLFDTCQATNFGSAWYQCALSQQSVDNILVSIDTAGQLNGTLGISGGTSSTPSTAGWAAYDSLLEKGWTITVNGSHPLSPWPPNCNPWVDLTGRTSISQGWLFCSSLKYFPLLDTSNITDVSLAWRGCTTMKSFAAINTSKVTNFAQAWTDCYALTQFPLIDTSKGTNFSTSWTNCSSLTSFPALNFNSATDFISTWTRCYNLVNFPANVFDNCLATNFYNAWTYCALSQQSVDNILVSLDTAGRSNGIVDLYEGASAYPSPTGKQAMDNLISRGWTVSVNTTNYIPYPDDFQNWQISSGSISQNAVTAPTGVGVADRWIESTNSDSNNQRRLYYNLASAARPIAGSTCSLSIYISRWNSPSPRNIALTFDDQVGMSFDLSNPSNSSGFQLSGFYNYVSHKVEPIGSFWYKCTLVFQLVSPIGVNKGVGIRMLNSSLSENYTGNNSYLTLYRAVLTTQI